ncbi:MAG: hypothetical protein ACXVAX_13985 [Pseudobdellovibrio sp.]
MKNKNSHLLLGAVGLLTANSPAATAHVTTHAAPETKMEALNVASFQSIESTWLKVPKACKARGFHADATEIINKAAAPNAQAIYAAYKV